MMIQQLGKHLWEIRATPGDGQQQDKPAQLDTSRGTDPVWITLMKNYKDLAMIENQEENTEAQNAKPSNNVVWIGQYREPWTWSDGSRSSFRNWNASYLNNYAGSQHCGIENSDHNWDDLNCDFSELNKVSYLKNCVK
uniref:C-type lectin domain-containing protein n=1 Tax=Oryzias sinensis TaxID=183150 RepID=A0A8C7WSC4_9TELE